MYIVFSSPTSYESLIGPCEYDDLIKRLIQIRNETLSKGFIIRDETNAVGQIEGFDCYGLDYQFSHYIGITEELARELNNVIPVDKIDLEFLLSINPVNEKFKKFQEKYTEKLNKRSWGFNSSAK